jgi:hypothetical protein
MYNSNLIITFTRQSTIYVNLVQKKSTMLMLIIVSLSRNKNEARTLFFEEILFNKNFNW